MPHDVEGAGYEHGGPLIEADWLTIPDPMVRWWSGPQTFALPTVAPRDVATAETCFRDFSGWILCVLRDSLEAIKYRERGYEEVPLGAPDFIPPSTPDVVEYEPPAVVPSDPQEGVSEDAAPVAIEWGEVFQGGVDLINAWGQSPVFQGPSQFVGSMPSAPPSAIAAPMTSCSCNSNPCVCGTINGRPALVDPRTGKRCYRRRRRVMLTEGDFNTLLRIATLPNNANVRTALAKAIGRR